jgi:hypothetical protein
LVRQDEHLQIATMSFTPVTAKDRERWRDSLEHLGPEEVRSRLNRTTTFELNEIVEMGELMMPWPDRSFVQGWLAEKRAKADRRDRSVRWWTIIAAVAAVIAAVFAAWPIVSQWFQ